LPPFITQTVWCVRSTQTVVSDFFALQADVLVAASGLPAVDLDRAEAAELLEVALDLLLVFAGGAAGRGLRHDGRARHGGDR
jgi:hypothetical protein